MPGVATDRTNLCVRAFEALSPVDGLTFRIRSEIPPSAGLGSSAAAIVAGLTAADHMFELDAPIFELARDIEGHPDNVAAAIHGGFVVCADDEPVAVRSARRGWRACSPRRPSRCPPPMPGRRCRRRSRSTDAVHNVAHASLLMLGLVAGRPLADRPRARPTACTRTAAPTSTRARWS